MTIGECCIAIFRVFIAVIIIWFFYRGHDVVRFIVRHLRNVHVVTTDAWNEWINVADEALFGKDEEENGCKDL